MCLREAGDREKRKRAGDDGKGKERKRGPLFTSSHRPPRAIYFSIIVIFIGIPSGSLCAGERKYAGFGSLALKTFVVPFLPTRLNAPAVSQRLISIHHDLRMNIFGLHIFKCTNS